MSVRVNLLPEATKQRGRAGQQRSLALLGGVLLLSSLGGIYLWGNGQLNAIEDRLAVEQLETSRLDSELGDLASFEELAIRQQLSRDQLVAALGDEVSVAGILQDFALVMPTDAQIETLQIVLETNPESAAPDGPPATRLGIFTMNGKTLSAHAPGVERVLLGLEKVATFGEMSVSQSALDDVDGDVATFTVDGQVQLSAATRRYVGGLPEDLR